MNIDEIKNIVLIKNVICVQHYVIKFVNDLRHVCGFLRVRWFPPPIKIESVLKHHKTNQPYNKNFPF